MPQVGRALLHSAFEFLCLALDARMESGLRNGNGKPHCRLLRQCCRPVRWERTQCTTEAQRADQLTAHDHGHRPCTSGPRGEQRSSVQGLDEVLDVDHLRLPPPQGLQSPISRIE